MSQPPQHALAMTARHDGECAAPDPIVRIRGLCQVFVCRERQGLFKTRRREIQALDEVSLDIYPGEIFGLLGPNGAGKTTLIKCLTTLLLPTRGEMRVNGYDVARDENRVRASIGCMLMGERGLYWKLTGRENLDYFGALYHIPRPARRPRVQEIIELLNLDSIVDRPVETYSSGQKMKLAFGRALINQAPLLILDEPTNTLDVHSARELRAIVQELNRRGHTVVYTTHHMVEAEELCRRMAIIDRGRVIALGTADEIKARLQRDRVIRVSGVIPAAACAAALQLDLVKQAAGALSPSEGGSAQLRVVTLQPRELLPILIRTLYDHGASISDLVTEQPSLEDVFVALTGRTLAQDTAEQPPAAMARPRGEGAAR